MNMTPRELTDKIEAAAREILQGNLRAFVSLTQTDIEAILRKHFSPAAEVKGRRAKVVFDSGYGYRIDDGSGQHLSATEGEPTYWSDTECTIFETEESAEAFIAQHADAPDSLKSEIEKARQHSMTDAEREQQRRSFAYGNANLANPDVTREVVNEAAEELAPAPSPAPAQPAYHLPPDKALERVLESYRDGSLFAFAADGEASVHGKANWLWLKTALDYLANHPLATSTSELRALVERWRRQADFYKENEMSGAEVATNGCASDLESLLSQAKGGEA